jgi:hypothetical protein
MHLTTVYIQPGMQPESRAELTWPESRPQRGREGCPGMPSKRWNISLEIAG